MIIAWRVACILLIFHKFTKAQNVVDGVLNLIEGVQKFYLAPSTFIVFDGRELDLTEEKVLVDVIKGQSKRAFMSQAITFKDLSRLPNRRENTLYTLFIHTHENLNHAINMTSDTNMSIHPWLLYINKTTKFNCKQPNVKFFKLKMDTRMTALCEGDTTLRSYRGLFDNETEVVDLATWIPETMQLDFRNEIGLGMEHRNLRGITLRVTAKVNGSDLTDNIPHFMFDIMDVVGYLSNFTTEHVVVEDTLGFVNHSTGKWFGMMKTLADNRADIGLALVTMSYTRMKVVDYAIPIAKGRCNLYIKLPKDAEVLWTTYFKVFNKSAWVTIGASICLLSTLVYLMKNGLRDLSANSFFEDFINIWGIFSMQGSSDTSSRVSIKIVHFSILFFSIILNAIYSASITSYITVLSPELSFSSVDEFLQDTTYSVVVVNGSREHSLVVMNRSWLATLKYQLVEPQRLPTHAYDGFQQACYGKTAFFSDEVKYDSLKNLLPCKLGGLDMGRFEYMSFVMTKNSPYKKSINYNILRLMDFGILKRLKNKYFQKNIELPDLQPGPITLKEIWSILIIWALGLVLSMIILLVEIVVYKCSRSFPNNRRQCDTLIRNAYGYRRVNFRRDRFLYRLRWRVRMMMPY